MEMLEGGAEEVQGFGEMVRPLFWAVNMQGGGHVEVEVSCPWVGGGGDGYGEGGVTGLVAGEVQWEILVRKVLHIVRNAMQNTPLVQPEIIYMYISGLAQRRHVILARVRTGTASVYGRDSFGTFVGVVNQFQVSFKRI